ncbi:MAG: hypothetical protein V3S65_10510 [Candidatus Aminicenantaceae bacterium]
MFFARCLAGRYPDWPNEPRVPADEKVPSDEERIESVKSRINPKTEFHVWLYQNRRWMKAEHKNVYIKN